MQVLHFFPSIIHLILDSLFSILDSCRNRDSQRTVNLLLNGTVGLEHNDVFIIPPFVVIMTVDTANSGREQHCFQLCLCI